MSAAPDGSFVQLKRLARLRYGDSLPEQDRIEGTTPVFGSNGPIGLHTSPNTGASVIVVGRKGSFGAVHYSDRPVFAIDTTFYIDPSTSSVDLRWLYYVLLSANLNTVSQDTGVPGLSREKTHSHRVRLVSELAQRQIADYLDAETGRIDALISAKRDLQSALSMKLQALIDARVSGDREPGERSMLGSRFFETLPQSWVLARLRNVVRYRNSNVDKKMVEGAQRVRLCNYTDVYYGGYLDSSETFMEATASDEEVRRFRLREGDVIVTKDSETAADIGVPAYVAANLDAVCGYHLTILTPGPLLNGEYLYWAMKSSMLSGYFETAANGVTRFGLTQQGIGDAPIPVPPLATQRQIAKDLRRSSLVVSEMSKAVDRQILLLMEYRQTLITSTVTGETPLPPDWAAAEMEEIAS